MEEFPSNRQREDSEPEPRVQPVVKNARLRKKPLGRRFAETFVEEDARSVGWYMVHEHLIPSVKDMIADTFIGGIERAFGRAPGPGRGRSRPGSRSNVSYDRYHTPDPRDRRARPSSVHQISDVEVDTRREAEDIVNMMYAIMEKYEVVKLSDFYEAAGMRPEYTDANFGWTDLEGLSIRRGRGVYIVQVPKVEPLD